LLIVDLLMGKASSFDFQSKINNQKSTMNKHSRTVVQKAADEY